MTKLRKIASRTARVTLSAALALVVGSGLICADHNQMVTRGMLGGANLTGGAGAGNASGAGNAGAGNAGASKNVPYQPASLLETVASRKVTPSVTAATRKYDLDMNVVKKAVDDFQKTPDLGDKYGFAISDGRSREVSSHNADTAYAPASTLKSLTALAAVHTLDMNSTLATEVYELNQQGGQATLIIKGQGDMLLGSGISDPQHVTGRAGLASLAQETVAKLKKQKVTQVSLAVDESFFTRSMPPHMPPEYLQIGYFTPTSAMAIDQGKQFGDWQKNGVPDSEAMAYAPREENPVPAAVASFAASLNQQGIQVKQGADGKQEASASQRKAIASQRSIAVVHSAPLWQILHLTLTLSDNTLAELFGRLVAHHLGYENSPAGARKAVYDTVKKLGVDLAGANLSDTSGLSDGSALTPRTLLAVQGKLLNSAGASAWEGQPVSGEIDTTGDLRAFTDGDHGVIHLKSGSLDDVTSMVASIETKRGGVVMVSVIVNNPPSHYAASRAIDKLLVDLIAA